MRRNVLVIGLLLMLAGGFAVYQGVQMLNPLADMVGLVSHVQTEQPLIPQSLLAVAPGNYSFIPVDLQGGVLVKGFFQVVDSREIAMYVMDGANFALWRAGRPSAIVLAKPTAIYFNFTLTPQSTGTYYFVFDNQDVTKRTVVFSLSVIVDTVVPSPFISNAGYFAFLLGIVLFAIGARTGNAKSKPPKNMETGIRCRFCGTQMTKGQTFCDKCGRAQQ
jgi:hypothetical protein